MLPRLEGATTLNSSPCWAYDRSAVGEWVVRLDEGCEARFKREDELPGGEAVSSLTEGATLQRERSISAKKGWRDGRLRDSTDWLQWYEMMSVRRGRRSKGRTKEGQSFNSLAAG